VGLCNVQVVVMTGQWICVHIDSKVMRRGNAPQIIRADMEKVFGRDLHRVVVVGGNLTPDFFESGVENYAFVKCSNYFEHVIDLKRSRVVSGVLEDYDHPNYCDEAEVERFARSVGPVERPYRYGDLVFIREGYLKGLRGIVVRLVRKGVYKVFFRLYTRAFFEMMSASNLVFEMNIVDKVRFPVTIQGGKPSSKGVCCFPKGAIDPDVAHILSRMARSENEDSLRRRRNRKRRGRK
jgi:hypothetical protein